MYAAKIVNEVYGPYTIIQNNAQFWFRGFCSGGFDVEDVARSRRPLIKNVDKIIVKVNQDRHMSNVYRLLRS